MKIPCYRCGKTIKRQPNKLGKSGHAFCPESDETMGCFVHWYLGLLGKHGKYRTDLRFSYEKNIY